MSKLLENHLVLLPSGISSILQFVSLFAFLFYLVFPHWRFTAKTRVMQSRLSVISNIHNRASVLCSVYFSYHRGISKMILCMSFMLIRPETVFNSSSLEIGWNHRAIIPYPCSVLLYMHYSRTHTHSVTYSFKIIIQIQMIDSLWFSANTLNIQNLDSSDPNSKLCEKCIEPNMRSNQRGECLISCLLL